MEVTHCLFLHLHISFEPILINRLVFLLFYFHLLISPSTSTSSLHLTIPSFNLLTINHIYSVNSIAVCFPPLSLSHSLSVCESIALTPP